MSVPAAMRVARLYRWGDVRIEEVAVPTPAPGEALLKVEACGVCGSDALVWYVEAKAGTRGTVLGHEPVGTIAALGGGVTHLAIGDRVFAHHHAACMACAEPPEPFQIHQRVAGVIELQLYAVVLVIEEQFPAVLVIAVEHMDDWPAHVGQAEQKPFLNLGELAALDDVGVAVGLVAKREQLVLAAELQREELVDERQIVVDPADLKDLLAAKPSACIPAAAPFEIIALFPLLAELALVPAVFDMAEQLDA
jgi:hypothetical protein